MNPATEILVSVLVLLGALAVLIAGIGVVRMPDLYARMQATSKAATLGAILLTLALAFDFRDTAITVRCILVVIFLALTAPVGAHVLARAGYLQGVRMRDPDAHDELEGRYDTRARTLDSEAPGHHPDR
jgi:multicomponent Na+:H+ antiporter subunit G